MRLTMNLIIMSFPSVRLSAVMRVRATRGVVGDALGAILIIKKKKFIR